jgi:membrane protein YdbS with pleckstrin-like domain
MTELTPLAPRARILFHLGALVRLALFWTPASVALAVAVTYAQSALVGGAVALAVWLLAALVAIWFPTLQFERWGYALSAAELRIQRGVLVRRVTAIPSHRIQHVDTHQGPLEQLFGLASVHIYTASGMGADGVIPGLERAEAERLKDELIAVGGDDGV